MFMKRIYLDYASLTPIDPHVLREMGKFSTQSYANPSSLYKEGVLAKKVLADARKSVADLIHAHADEIVFTSGGTEANNLALDGVVRAARAKGIIRPHIIISAIEHSSIIETARMLAELGYLERHWRVGDADATPSEPGVWDERWLLAPGAVRMTLRPLFERLWSGDDRVASARLDVGTLDRPLGEAG